MRKVCAIFAFLAAVCLSAAGQDQYARYNGSCQQGGSPVQTNGIDSSQPVQISYPACTIVVFNHGSIVQASIFSDAAGTLPIIQPFTATSTGSFGFYAANGRYDVQLSGAGIVSPFTISDVTLCFNCSGGGGGGSPGGLNTQVQVNNAGAFGGLTNVVPGSLFASAGASTFPFFQLKQIIDIRDVSGVDCTGTSDSSTALNALTNAQDTVTNKTLSFRGCPLVRLDSQWLIHGQENLEVDLGNAQKPDAGSATTGNTLIFGCNGSAGAVVRVDRSGFLDLHGGGITAKGNACASSFTESLEFTNSGLGGYTSTHNHISDIFISPNTGGASIASYTGIFINGGPNQEMFDIKNADIYCNNSTSSIGFRQTSPNSDSTTLHDGFMVSKCFYGVSNEAGGIVRLRYANLTSNGNFSVFGTGGAAVRGPVQEMANTVLGDGSGPLQVAEPGSQNGGYFVNNHFGASTADIDPTSYYMTAGPNVSIQLQGNIFDIAGAGTCANLNASTIIGPGGSNAAVLDLGANQKKASCNLWVNPLPSSALLATNTFNDISEIAAPSAPGAGLERLYGKAGAGFCAKDSGGTERCTGSGGGGTPGGSNTQLQYNNAGAFGGIANAAIGSTLASEGTSTTPAFQSKTIIDVRDYGAVPDGSTDNATAIAAAFTAANAVTTGGEPVVQFGCNGATTTCQYNYSGAGVSVIHPTRPMAIECDHATLNYTGTAHAMDIGPSGLVLGTLSANPYSIEGCTFTGGTTQTAGIFVNTYVTGGVSILRNWFINYGNTSAYDIQFDQNAWDPRIIGNYWLDTGGTVKAPLVDTHAANNVNGIIAHNQVYCISSCAVAGQPLGFWLGGSNPIFSDNVILGHSPILRLSGGNNAQIQNNTFAGTQLSTMATPAITFGDPTAAGTNGGCTAFTNNFITWGAISGVSAIGIETPSSGSQTISSCSFVNNFFANPIVGTNQPYINTNGGAAVYWTGPYPANSSGPSPTHPIFDTTFSKRAAAYWQDANPDWGLMSPKQTQSVGFGTSALIARDQYTRLNAIASGLGDCLDIAQVDYWCMDGTNFNFTAQTDGTNVSASDHRVGSTTAAIHGAHEDFTSAPCETSDGLTTINTGAATTTTGLNCLPANSIIDAVVYRIGVSIGTAASFTVGDGTTAARFCSTQSTLTANTTGICFVQADQTGAAGPRQVAAAAIVLTFNTTPSTGTIRLHVFYHTWTPPTS